MLQWTIHIQKYPNCELKLNKLQNLNLQVYCTSYVNDFMKCFIIYL